MPYDFFFSYTHCDQDPYLDQFFERLSTAVRRLRNLPQGTEVGFRDQNDVELGSEWNPLISDALQNSRVLVSLYSPGYFSSPYCGKEWETFWRRCELYRTQNGQAQVPPSIKPVIWKSLEVSNLTPKVEAIQFRRGNPHAVANNEGLQYLLRLLADHRSDFDTFVNQLASDIVLTADSHELPALTPLPLFSDVQSAWETASAIQNAGAGARSTITVTSPKHVRFVFVAADPNQFGNIRSVDPYLDTGGGDWKPFYPDTSAIGPFVQHIVSDKELGFTSDELKFSDNLVDEIEEAWKDRKIVILIVDGWSVSWGEKYRQVLNQLNGRNFLNCSVLVPWNENDSILQQQQHDILETLKETFSFRAEGNPIFYRSNIRSADELRDALRDVLTRIKAEIRRLAVVTHRLPNLILKPIISGPGQSALR